MASVASVWDEGVDFGAPSVIASMPLRRHGTSLQFGSRPVPWYNCCSFIFHFSFCSAVRELGISVGGCVKISGVMNSGLVRCWHVVLVCFFYHVSSVVGVSAANCEYLRVRSSMGWLWSLCADMVNSAISCSRASLSVFSL